MISVGGAYDPSGDQKDKDDILSAFLKSTSMALGKLGCNVIKAYQTTSTGTITNTAYADVANMTAGFKTSGGACLVIAKIDGGMGSGVSCYGQLTIDDVVVDEGRVGSAGGVTNGTIFLFHLIEGEGSHAAKVQTKVDSGTFTKTAERFYVIEILRG